MSRKKNAIEEIGEGCAGCGCLLMLIGGVILFVMMLPFLAS